VSSRNIRIGLVGCGVVGTGVLDILHAHAGTIEKRLGARLVVEQIAVRNLNRKRAEIVPTELLTDDPLAVARNPNVDIVVEVMGGIEPAEQVLREALERGKHVVTANKALLAQRGREIFALARKYKRVVGFEASVCGAIPLIEGIARGLSGCDIKKVQGIVNGTTNYILYRMLEDRADFAKVLKDAQDKGLAERNPRFDIDGIDAMHKLCILTYICFGVWPDHKRVYAEGIRNISLADILYAEELGYRIKLLAIAHKENNILDLRVHPALVVLDHPLAEVDGAYNAAFLDTYPAGQLLFYGMGAGGVPTSSAVIADIINIGSGAGELPGGEEKALFKKSKDIKARYYLRCMAKDVPGVLAQITRIFSACNISIASVKQRERNKGQVVPVLMITHEVKEDNLRRAIGKIDKLPFIKGPSQVIRIEDL